MVSHPEKGSDIVTLGMVGEINVSAEGITLVLVPEKSNDPFLASIKSSCVRAVKEHLGPDAVIASIEVRPMIVVEKIAVPKREVLPGVKTSSPSPPERAEWANPQSQSTWPWLWHARDMPPDCLTQTSSDRRCPGCSTPWTINLMYTA